PVSVWQAPPGARATEGCHPELRRKRQHLASDLPGDGPSPPGASRPGPHLADPGRSADRAEHGRQEAAGMARPGAVALPPRGGRGQARLARPARTPQPLSGASLPARWERVTTCRSLLPGGEPAQVVVDHRQGLLRAARRSPCSMAERLRVTSVIDSTVRTE